MIKIGKYDFGREELKLGLIIFFALVTIFLLGYRFAYGQAIVYANDQITEICGDTKQPFIYPEEHNQPIPEFTIDIPEGLDNEG